MIVQRVITQASLGSSSNPIQTQLTETPGFEGKTDLELGSQINKLWENKILFSFENLNDPFYEQIMSSLIKAILERRYQFSSFTSPHSKRNNFVTEMTSLVSRNDMSEMEKSLMALQATEIALSGGNPSGVLSSINSNKSDRIRGYKNELLGGWFLNKFAYKFSPANKSRFVHSEFLPTFHKIESLDKFSYQQNALFREVDITTEDKLISIKSGFTNLHEQIAKLFFVIFDGSTITPSLELDSRVKKLVILKTGSDEQIDFDYYNSASYSEAKRKTISDALSFISKIRSQDISKGFGGDCSRFDYLLNSMICEDAIDIYFLPNSDISEDCWKNRLSNWIDECYKLVD